MTYLIKHLQGGKIKSGEEWRRITKAETFHANGGIQHVSHLKSGFLKVNKYGLITDQPTKQCCKYIIVFASIFIDI